MSFKKIKELRHEGNLEKAYKLATEVLQSDPEDLWNKRSLMWVYYDYLKRYANKESFDNFLKILKEIKKLEVPKEEDLFFDKLAWQVSKLIFDLNRTEKTNHNYLNKIFEEVRELDFPKDEKSYSVILKAFLKSDNWHNLPAFMGWWGWENITSEYFIIEENDPSPISLGESAYINVAKYYANILDGMVDPETMEDVEEFIVRIDGILKIKPDLQYVIYYKAKLLLVLHKPEDARAPLIKFAKNKSFDSWVWDSLASTFPGEREKKFACLCKALTCKGSDKLLVKTRQKIAGILLQMGMKSEAKFEIERVIETRQREGWKLNDKLQEWIEEPWFRDTISSANNQELYEKHAPLAEEVLFYDMIPEIVIVENVNPKKKILNFIKNKEKHGFFKYNLFNIKPKVGDVLEVRLKKVDIEGFFKVYTIKPTEDEPEVGIVKEFSGDLELAEGQGFGFVGEVFIPPDLLRRTGFNDGQEVFGKAIKSFNKKRGEWGWKGYELF